MEKSIKQNLSKFHFHKLKITCPVDGLYKGTIAFHFHTDARIWTHRLKNKYSRDLKWKTPILWCYKWTLLNSLGYRFYWIAIFMYSTMFLWKPIWHKTTQECFMEMTCFCPQYYWRCLVLQMDIIEHLRIYFVIKQQFTCNSVLLWTHPIPGMQHFCLHRRSETT